MSDLRLRELERRYLESGEPEHEAEFLREAVRSGTLTERSLWIAADLGYPPARLAEGREPIRPQEISRLGYLLRERWGQYELVRLVSALVTRLVPERGEFASAHELALRPAFQGLRDWLKRPGTPPRRTVRLAMSSLAHEELEAEFGEPVALVIHGAQMAIVAPPMRGTERHPSYEAIRLAWESLGQAGYLDVLRADVVPGLFAQA